MTLHCFFDIFKGHSIIEYFSKKGGLSNGRSSAVGRNGGKELHEGRAEDAVRLSEEAARYIDAYPGDNFSSKLENLVLDIERRRSELSELDKQLSSKRGELSALSKKIRGYRTIDLRLTALIAALLSVLGDSN